jgi:MFS family permease
MTWIDKLRSSPKMMLVVVAFALFVDYYVYGMVAPLASVSPAHIEDESIISLLYGAYALGLIIATPILGIITDRIGRRKPMLTGIVLLVFSMALFAMGTNKEALFAARMLEGAAAACTWTAALALAAEYFVVNRVQAMGIAMLGGTTGSVLGPLIGGKMFDIGGYLAPFYVACALVAIDAVLRFVFIPAKKGVEAQQAWKETFSELGGIVTDKSVIAAAFAVALAAASWAIMEPLFPMHVKKIAHASPTEIGALFTVSNLIYAFMAPVVAWVSDRLGVRHTTILGLVLTAIMLPMLALSPNMIFASIALCSVSVAYAFTLNPTSAELGNAVDRRGSTSYAVAYAIYNLAYSLGMICTDSYVEYVTDQAHKLQLLHILLIMSGMFLLCVPMFLFKPKDVHEQVAQGAETDAPPVAPNTNPNTNTAPQTEPAAKSTPASEPEPERT